MTDTWWVVGDPADVRTVSLRQELAGIGIATRVIDTRAVLRDPDAALVSIPPGATVRLESPGRAHDLYRQLLAAGADEAAAEGGPTIPARAALELEDERGRIRCSRQWYLGFRRVLRLAKGVLGGRGACFQNDPDELAVTLDKRATRARLAAAGVPIPCALGPVRSVADLHRKLEAARRRGFLKPRHGSSAAGVLAVRLSPSGMLVADTTVASEGAGALLRLYNSRRVRRLTGDAEIGAIVDALAPQHLELEEWVPKAGLDGRTIDLRVVTIAGEPRHAVVRLARGPITNLHLSNQRCSAEVLRARLAPATWRAIEHSCRVTAAAFPGCLYLGLDVLVTAGLRGHRVIEVNGFGDLLKGVRHEGLTPYEAEARAWKARAAA